MIYTLQKAQEIWVSTKKIKGKVLSFQNIFSNPANRKMIRQMKNLKTFHLPQGKTAEVRLWELKEKHLKLISKCLIKLK